MHPARLLRFAVFLSSWKPGEIKTTVRPHPDLGENLVLQAIIQSVEREIGHGDAQLIVRYLRRFFDEQPRLEPAIDKTWDRYGDDEAFLAYVHTILCARQ